MQRPRPGILVSSAVHAAVLAWIVFGFSGMKLDAAPSEPVPVDIISPAQFDHLTKGAVHAKAAKEARVKAEKIAPAKPKPNPKLALAKEDVTPPPPPPAPAVKAPPKPAPKEEAEAAPPPKPAPPAPAKAPPTPPALPVPAPRHELADADIAKKPPRSEKPAPKVEKTIAKLEKPKPKERLDHREMTRLDKLIAAADKTTDERAPPKKTAADRPQKEIAAFDPDKIAALIDRRTPSRTAATAPQLAANSSAGVADGAEGQLSLSEQTRIAEMVRQQVERCWSPPAGALGADNLQVVLAFSLRADGSLVGNPVVVNRSAEPFFQVAAESAERAVHECSPLHLPSQYYDYWKEVQIKFDPRDMMRG